MASVLMNKDQVFNAEFIQLVKAHPCLYNWNLAEYKQVQNQEKAWEEVAKQSNDIVGNVRKRWRNLRCSMTRYLKTCRAGGNIPRKYYLADQMQFMIPFLKLKEDNCLRTYVDANDTDDNMTMKIVDVKTDLQSSYSEKLNLNGSTTDDEEKHEVYEIETLDDVIENETDDLIETSHTEDQQEQEHQQHQQDQQQQQDQQSITMREYDLDQLPQFTNSQVQSPPMKKFKITEVSLPPSVAMPTTSTVASTVQDDADMNFLKSLIPDLQLMSAPQKRKFKVTILSLIDELLSASTTEKS